MNSNHERHLDQSTNAGAKVASCIDAIWWCLLDADDVSKSMRVGDCVLETLPSLPDKLRARAASTAPTKDSVWIEL